MKKYTEMNLAERQAEYAAVQAEYEKLKGMGLNLKGGTAAARTSGLFRGALRRFLFQQSQNL